ncbi:hypothetical protein [Nonomuraea sp. NPDC049709]|uniref:hypothetical protein n=1 Tax=Nonomuraea sp. NPDC049709 TaxID=3154736 RepID=UPI00342CA714
MLDAAGLDGLYEEGEPESSRDRSGYQLTGHGDKVEVSYEGRRTVRWRTRTTPTSPTTWATGYLLFRRRIETVMLGTLAEILMAAGFGYTCQPAAGERAAMLLVHSRSAPGEEPRRFRTAVLWA